MGLKSDKWIKEMSLKHGMISPFESTSLRKGVISYGVSSYGYDIRVADEYKIFTNVNSTIVSSSSSVQPRRSAPVRMTSREHPAANFLSLNFFFSDDNSISVQDFDGRIFAAAPISPVSSSAAKRIFSICSVGSTSVQMP